jgi:hypothetical protein
MRTLKDGTVKFKPSALKEAARMAASPLPMDAYRRGTRVAVYLGAGWSTGTVESSTRERCVVWLGKAQRRVSCSDNRNVRLAPEK